MTMAMKSLTKSGLALTAAIALAATASAGDHRGKKDKHHKENAQHAKQHEKHGKHHGMHASKEDKKAIKTAIFDYFEGQGERSLERMQRAFDLDANMITVAKDDDGQDYLRKWDMAPTLERWSQGEPSPDAKERKGKILNMQVVDGRIASVLFDSNGRFYDVLTLGKINGEWKIINKAFIRR